MPTFGGMSPYPRRFGGGRTRIQTALEALNLDRGTAYATDDREAIVYVENMALARALAAAWSTNARLGSIWDAARMPLSVVSRWEKIMSITPAPTDDEVTRRARIRERFERFGRPSINSLLTDTLEEALGAVFVAVEYISYANARILVPDGTYPWGIVGEVPWSSTVAQVLVRLQKPTGWTEGQFYEAAGRVASILEPWLPAWCQFAWYRPGTTSSVVGGISAAGFYLDDANNLDNQVFGS